jgi:hypothetical protein
MRFSSAEGTAFMPNTASERAEVVRWLIYEQTDVMPMTGGLGFRLMTGRLEPDEPGHCRRKGGRRSLASDDAVPCNSEFLVGGRYSDCGYRPDMPPSPGRPASIRAGPSLQAWPGAWPRRQIHERPGTLPRTLGLSRPPIYDS